MLRGLLREAQHAPLCATLSALPAGFRGALAIMSKISTAMLPALPTGFRGALRIIREVASAFVAALASGFGCKVAIAGKATLFVRYTFTALPGDFPLLLYIHRCKAAVGCTGALFSHHPSP
jgi:hypothetical protein